MIICTDGAAAMTGNIRGFVSYVKQQNPAIQITHCCIHREVLMVKNLPAELLQTMNECIKIINIIKSRALNSRIFEMLCEEMGSEYKSSLFHTEVRWLSRGKVLARLFEPRYEVSQFLLNQDMPGLFQQFENKSWIAKLAYMAEIFDHLNEKCKVQTKIYLTCFDKLQGFKNKLELWQNELRQNSLQMFQRTQTTIEQQEHRELIVVFICMNLLTVCREIRRKILVCRE